MGGEAEEAGFASGVVGRLFGPGGGEFDSEGLRLPGLVAVDL